MTDIVERAREFCLGAFGPFSVDIEPYAKIIAELIEGAVADERAENARLRAENKWLYDQIAAQKRTAGAAAVAALEPKP